MNEPHTVSDATADSGSAASPAYRLVIRAQIVPDAPLEIVRKRTCSRPIIWIATTIAALLVSGWIGISMFKDDSPSKSAAIASTQTAQVPSRISVSPAQPTSPSAAAPSSVQTPSIEPGRPEPAMPTREMLPEVPRSALQTIRGKIRVEMRVTIDPQGKVIDVISETPGPSRYFERLSRESARQWSFTPAASNEPRSVLLRFHFTRDGRTAQAVTPQ